MYYFSQYLCAVYFYTHIVSLITANISFCPSSQFLRVEQDKECNMDCSGAPRKSLCASDGRTFSSRCEFLRAKCRDPQLEVIRGPCKGQGSPIKRELLLVGLVPFVGQSRGGQG